MVGWVQSWDWLRDGGAVQYAGLFLATTYLLVGSIRLAVRSGNGDSQPL